MVRGRGRLDGPHRVLAEQTDGGTAAFDADTVLVAIGARPRELPDALPDGERILSWTQLYDLQQLPERLIVVGSGVTGAEFACAYDALGAEVVLVSSRDRVLPGRGRRRGRRARGRLQSSRHAGARPCPRPVGQAHR